MGGIYSYYLYFNINPPQSEVIHKLQLRFSKPLLIIHSTHTLLKISSLIDKEEQVDVWWINERNLTLPPELVGVVELPFPDLPQAIQLEATPVKLGLFTYGPGRVLTSITQLLEEFGGKSKLTH